jgi:folate-binding protein YgfZ
MLDRYAEIQAHLHPYGDPNRGLLVPMVFEHVELEYAAIRKGCALVDLPQSGSVELEGADRRAFLNNLVTQELKTLEPMRSVRSFWLNRKGRIDADLRICDDGRMMRLATDALVAGKTAEALAGFVFTEDVAIRDATESTHRLALHGPRSANALMSVADTDEHVGLEPGQAMAVMVRGTSVLVEREDSTGEKGLVLTMPTEHARAVYDALAGLEGVRPCGWLAYNVARIEAGWPLFQIDFTGENLPAETGVLRDRVSFTKGCYLGQEVVARMQSLGKPKQVLVALRLAKGQEPKVPGEGAAVFAQADSDKPIGTVTSSTYSPMLGAAPIALAQVRTAHAEAGTMLHVDAGAGRAAFEVQPQLASWTGAASVAPERQ